MCYFFDCTWGLRSEIGETDAILTNFCDCLLVHPRVGFSAVCLDDGLTNSSYINFPHLGQSVWMCKRVLEAALIDYQPVFIDKILFTFCHFDISKVKERFVFFFNRYPKLKQSKTSSPSSNDGLIWLHKLCRVLSSEFACLIRKIHEWYETNRRFLVMSIESDNPNITGNILIHIWLTTLLRWPYMRGRLYSEFRIDRIWQIFRPRSDLSPLMWRPPWLTKHTWL